MSAWREIGDRIFVRRYAFWDQNIGVVLGDDAALLIDTRATPGQAREVLANLRELTRLPIELVVDTHGHSDHAFGNAVFRPATIWGHAGCVRFLEQTWQTQRDGLIATLPELAEGLRQVVLDPPDRVFEDVAEIDVGGRPVKLRYLGRGHTDHDTIVAVPGSGVVFAGDLLENGAVPYFGDGYPLDWPSTVERLAGLVEGVVVPGHGDPGGLEFVLDQLAAFREVAALGGRIAAGELDMEAALDATPYPAYPLDDLREPLERTLAQLRGELA